MYEIYEWADGAGKDKLTIDIWMHGRVNDGFSYQVEKGGVPRAMCETTFDNVQQTGFA